MEPSGLHRTRMVERSESAAAEPEVPGRMVPAPFASVLVPVDFSRAARVAYTLAVQMTAPWNTEIILFSAPGSSANDGFLAGTGASWGKSDVVNEERGHLRSFAETVAPGSESRVRVEARRGEDYVRSLAEVCERLAPSLVVIGADADDLGHWRRSLAERVLCAVSCPVLVVPA